MKKFIAGLALAAAATGANALEPTTAPEGIRVDIVEDQTCTQVRNSVQDHLRNVFALRRALGEVWYRNSRGEYLAFDCYRLDSAFTPYRTNVYSVIYVTDKATIDAAVRAERAALQEDLRAQQQIVQQSGYQ